MLAFAERALAPLDAVRSRALRALGRRGRVFLVSRDARVLLYASISTCVALALTFVAPLALLAFGPLVLGVPHLASDARYLVARPGLHRRRALCVVVAIPLALTWIWPTTSIALLGVAAVAIVARGGRGAMWRRALVLVVAATGAYAARDLGYTASLAIAYAHNFVALALWWLLARRTARHLVPIALVIAGSVLIFVVPASMLGGVSADFIDTLSPVSPLDDPAWALRFTLLFAFTQAAHYAIWLRLVPEDARERTGIRSFRATLRALVRDCGGVFVGVAAALALAVAIYGVVDAEAARLSYLRVAFFHGYLEVSVLALVFVEGVAVLRRQRVAC